MDEATPAIQAVIAGEVQFCFENPATAVPQIKSPELTKTLENLAVGAIAQTPEAFGAFLAKETARLAPVIKAAGVEGQ